jgi:hypothetical protein
MKLRSFFYILAPLVLTLLVVGAGGFFWLTAQNPLVLLRNHAASPTAAIFVSRQAPIMASLLVNPDQLEAFSKVVVAPGERRRTRVELNQFKQTLLSNTGLDYQQDVRPWLGREVTLALTTLDIDRDESNGRQPGYLIALASQNPERSREFLQLFWQKRALTGADLVFEQYKGVKLIYAEPNKLPASTLSRQTSPPTKIQPANSVADTFKPTLASAIVGDRFVLFANHPKVLREAINNVQAADLNLTNSPLYQRTLDKLNQNRIGLAFVNLPKLADWLGSESQPGVQSKASSQSEATPPEYQSLVVSLALNPQGLLAETALLGTSESRVAALPALSKPVGALQYLPANSPIAAAGKDLNQLWQQTSASLGSYDAVSQLLDRTLANLKTRWGVQLAEDIFSWVQGEYALGLLPTDSKTIEPLQNWVFVAERSIPETQPAIEQLDTIARQQGLSVGPLQLEGKTVSVWTRLSAAPTRSNRNGTLALQADIQGVHTSIGKYEIFATSVEAMNRALKATENALVTSTSFTQAIDSLSRPNNGYLYLDWLTAQPLLEQQFPLFKVVELAGKPFFDHIRSVTLSSYGTQAGVQRGGVFIKLGKA